MVETPIYAMNEGSSPILSYNYGAQRPKRVRKAIRVMTCMILIYTAIMWSVIIFAPEFLIGIFSSDKELLVDAVEALKLYIAAFIFMDLQYIGQTVFKSLNKKKQAIFFSLLRKVFIVVPLTYLFPYYISHGNKRCVFSRTDIKCNRRKFVFYYNAGNCDAGVKDNEEGKLKKLALTS